jgi:tetratricopeptide (TPR) repeat protein
MTEHVHPNIEGNFLMAQAFFNGIVQSEVIGKKSDDSPVSLEYHKQNWGYTVLDSLLAHHRIQQLKGFWPFVKDIKNEYNYREQYKPKSYLDSLAFTVMKNPDLSMDEARLDLAKKYEKTGQIEKAYMEYEALLRTNPYVAVNYRDAANCLLQLSDLPLALKYLQKSLEYEESFFARYRIGEIYLMKGDFNNAIQSFEKSFSLAPDDKKVNVLAKSYTAFVYANKTEQAKAVAAELGRVKANQYLNVPPKKYVYSQYVPFQTKDQINMAKQLIAENKNDEALAVLEFSLMIYDSHIANRIMGEIYQGQQNYEKAFFYFSKAYIQFKFDPRFLHNFTLIYLGKNDNVNARKCLEEIKLIDPGYEQLGELNSLFSTIN